jgi:CubicO group peptidase (beta-lactamase class C family)
MNGLTQSLDALASETRFSGAVRVDDGDQVVLAKAYGLADRAHDIPNRVETQFGIASGTKGLTALVCGLLLQEGVLELTTPARSLLGDDLPLVDDRVTVEHLLAHRSGIGDYLDEANADISDYLLPVPVHELDTTESYVRVLDGHPQKFPPDERFEYCNGGFVLLALLAERASGVPFHELVVERVCRPAGMVATDFLRSDELPATAAVGYLEDDGPRTNVFHLPVRGNGDGGIYSTVADVSALWRAFFAGRILAADWVREFLRPRSAITRQSGARYRYGLGLWLHASTNAVLLEGYDAGVSFRSTRDADRGITHTVVSNTTEGAFPLARLLTEQTET